MKKYNRIILSFCIFLLCPGLASATSLDELYRDIVRSDNQGYLPMFVKNRSIPDVLIEEEILRQIPENQESQPKKNALRLSNWKLSTITLQKTTPKRSKCWHG